MTDLLETIESELNDNSLNKELKGLQTNFEHY